MDTTINFYFYSKHRELSIGDSVTVAKVEHGECVGERAVLSKVAARYAEFVTTSGARVKVYARTDGCGSIWYLGHRLPAGWQNGGWFVDVDPEREITVRHPAYLVYVEKNGDFEWRDR